MSYIPKNAKQILKNSKLLRQYALKPFGFDAPQNCNFPKTKPTFKFFEHEILLHRPGPTKKIQPNTIVYKVNQQLSKPEIKQYLTKLYGLKITKVNTARFMGKVYKDYQYRPKVTKGFKKAFVITQHKIPEFLNQEVL